MMSEYECLPKGLPTPLGQIQADLNQRATLSDLKRLGDPSGLKLAGRHRSRGLRVGGTIEIISGRSLIVWFQKENYGMRSF